MLDMLEWICFVNHFSGWQYYGQHEHVIHYCCERCAMLLGNAVRIVQGFASGHMHERTVKHYSGIP